MSREKRRLNILFLLAFAASREWTLSNLLDNTRDVYIYDQTNLRLLSMSSSSCCILLPLASVPEVPAASVCLRTESDLPDRTELLDTYTLQGSNEILF